MKGFLDNRDFVEYVQIVLGRDTDIDELEKHLSMNAYNFGIDRKRGYLFAYIEEIDFVESILLDREIKYTMTDY